MNMNLIDVDAMSHGAKAAVQCQKEYFNTNITKSFEWRLDQLDRLSRMLSENMNAFSEAVGSDFKTALSEKVFEVAALIGLAQLAQFGLELASRFVAAANRIKGLAVGKIGFGRVVPTKGLSGRLRVRFDFGACICATRR